MNYKNYLQLAFTSVVVSLSVLAHVPRKPVAMERGVDTHVDVKYWSSHCGDDYYGSDYMQCQALAEGRVGGMWALLGLGLRSATVHTTNHGPLYFTHGLPGQVHEVPAGHKLVTCYCDQDECLIRNPAGPLLVKAQEDDSAMDVHITIVPTVDE